MVLVYTSLFYNFAKAWEISIMSQPNQVSKRKRRSKAVPMAGLAGVSLAVAGGASAANAPIANVPLQATAPSQEITLGEEEISDVSLATFYVFDKENAGAPQLGKDIQLAKGGHGCGHGGHGCGHGGRGRGGRGCRGCGRGCGHGCGCWGGCGCGCCISWGGCAFC